MLKKRTFISAFGAVLLSISGHSFAEELPSISVEDKLFQDTTTIAPTSTVTAEQIETMNIVNTEDAISMQPGLIVRKRFIGDPNGVIGIRGSNMFQGHRSMVFSDGLPLHYHLQTRFSGAPRWSLVSPNEIEKIDVIYGPFSAEYSGNAMGGVVNIRTKVPTKREITLSGSLFLQDYDELQTNDQYRGESAFMSFADRIGNLGIYASFNHLDNDGQPQSYFFVSNIGSDSGATAVNGPETGINNKKVSGYYYGDNGQERAQTDLFKLKLDYQLGEYELRARVAYETRERDLKNLNSYAKDASGNTIWNGDVKVGAESFSISGSNFQERYQERNSLLYGLGLSGPVAQSDWLFDLYYSDFDILKDEEIRTARNPNDPDYVSQNASFKGRFTDAEDTGWEIFDAKAGTESLFSNPKARLSVGYHYDNYELSIKPFKYDSVNKVKGDSRGASGGETETHAVFAQFGYGINDQVDVALGIRYEDWSSDGAFSSDGATTAKDRNEKAWSPKLSIGYFPSQDVTLRYSVARAVRFPIVEELYRNESTGDRQFNSDPDLEPEDGIHHNLSLEKQLKNGLVKVNLFHEEVDDVIFTFSAMDINNSSITTTLPVDTVETSGAEFIFQQAEFFHPLLDMQFNLTYTDAEITKNELNTDIEGKRFPRIPKWRSNLGLTYHYSSNVNLSTNFRYASNSYGELDNSDKAKEVFGAQDDYFFVNLKAKWQMNSAASISAGIDNVFNEETYVYHPWPSRTFFTSAKYTF